MGSYKRFQEQIKEENKGGFVLFLSKSHYKSMILSQLHDEKICEKSNTNPDQAIMKKIKLWQQSINHYSQIQNIILKP